MKMEIATTAHNASPSQGKRYFASFVEAIYEIFRRCVVWIISAGPIPNHVAFIMDGNRRYANHRQMSRCSGHQFGYDSLAHTLRNCYELGVKYVSVYAFSIENFRRSEEEVSTLMNLMQEKLEALIQKESMVRKYGIRVQILGDLSLLPERVRNAADRAMAVTEHNERAVLNICAPYTSTQEIVKAVQEACEEVLSRVEMQKIPAYQSGDVNGISEVQNSNGSHPDDAIYRGRENCRRQQLRDLTLPSADVDDDHDAKELKKLRDLNDSASEEEVERQLLDSITADEIERHLYTSNCPEPELLIRTSGETRLSSFLLWQSSFSYLYVTRILWPEFSFRHLIMAIIKYQRAYPILQQKRRELKSLSSHAD